MTLLADLLSTVFERRYRLSFGTGGDNRPVEDLAEALVGSTAETSGLTLAAQILDRYAAMDDTEKLAFFRHLATAMNIDPVTVKATLDAYEAEPSKATYRAFVHAAEPKRHEFIKRLNHVPGATEALVRMRADLLQLGAGEDALQALDLDFRHLFVSWFNRGFLVLRPINWESPALILEKIIAYEAVHSIDSWEDLRRRVEPSDRRCFAFFHPAMPDEPLIFVEVALTKDVPGSVQSLLTEDRQPISDQTAKTAVFYSISNCQPGLAGISFGNSLIKQVAADLAFELPGLKTFVTLSPIPGLMGWAMQSEIEVDPSDALSVRQLAAHYLLEAKRGDGQPHDPVARFHLGNGAIIHAVHAEADTSQKGMAQSAGAMVNYLYDLSRTAQNHEDYASKRKIAATNGVRTAASAFPTGA
ncbi:malonyl-CoA decarboxylase [Thalassococcus sp. S3]|uniref:malonyl-CoA decarboxylase n=1 Tax=Thalassococcus sp. S3 TaxID=2017482 RepID=UPI00102407CE|nr:malonyl-CoA decarboxylase [Thalassococcus sp. S3]QBF33642.1 decarboxylase [Thalassococcus sp. S3]